MAAGEVAQLAHQPHGAIGITREYRLHPLARALWAGRDVDLPEDRWARLLGDSVLVGGERALWEELTTDLRSRFAERSDRVPELSFYAAN